MKLVVGTHIHQKDTILSDFKTQSFFWISVLRYTPRRKRTTNNKKHASVNNHIGGGSERNAIF